MELNKQIDFSDENIITLAELTDSLGDTLIHSHFGGYVDQLSLIRLSAERKDQEVFKKNVLDRSIFGGMGSLGDIWIEDVDKREDFKNKFRKFIDHLKKMGIDNPRVNQVREYFDLN